MPQTYHAESMPDGYIMMVRADSAAGAKSYMANRFERPRSSIRCRKASEEQVQKWLDDDLLIVEAPRT